MAAVILATSAQTFDVPSYVQYPAGGTTRRLKMLVLEGPKAAINDWFLLTTYGITAANVVSFHGHTTDTTPDWTIDTFTYVPSDAKLILLSATVGTEHLVVYYFE